MKKLNRATVETEKRPVKVLQFGEGNFLRAFVDWMIDIMNEKAGFHGDVQIVQPIGQGMGKMINDQDGLFHVILNGIRGGKEYKETRLISCVQSVLNPYDDYHSFLALAENPDLQFIISNTTEAGISFDENDTNPNRLSSSFPGKLTSLLYHRFRYFQGSPDKALTIIPCELIDKNGEQLREVIIRYAYLWNLPEGFVSWIRTKTLFCNTLVDRIVPGFPKEDIGVIQEDIGYLDNLVVTAEPFHLWVIQPCLPFTDIDSVELRFPARQAGLDVLFTTDQSPYRTRKVRILNGAHTALVPVAYLRGLRTVKEAVDDKDTGAFIRKAIFEEIIPTLDLPQNELIQFANDVTERFQNPSIKHELISIALNSVSKFRVRVLPSILEFINRKNKLPELLLTSMAALIYFYRGNFHGEKIPLNDTPQVLDFMNKAWSGNDPVEATRMILNNEDFWGTNLTRIDNLLSLVTEKVASYAELSNR